MFVAMRLYFFPMLSPLALTISQSRPVLTWIGSLFVPAMAASRRSTSFAPAGTALAWASLTTTSTSVRPASWRALRA